MGITFKWEKPEDLSRRTKRKRDDSGSIYGHSERRARRELRKDSSNGHNISSNTVINDDCDDEEHKIALKSKKNSLIKIIKQLMVLKQSTKLYKTACIFTFLYDQRTYLMTTQLNQAMHCSNCDRL